MARELPDLLLGLQDAEADQSIDIEDRMMTMRVGTAYPIDDEQSGVVHLHAEGWSGSAGRDDTLAAWVENVLRDQSDVPAKLGACPEGERHAFLWATIGSDYSTQFKLENRDDEPLPQRAPDLPDGVTHIWVAGSMSSQGALAWFPDRGWWRAWEPPVDGSPVELTT